MSAADSPSTWPVWAGGRLIDPAEPAIRVDDAGFQLGLGVYDTLLVERGLAYFLDEHLERLGDGARALGITWPLEQDLTAALTRVIEALDGRTAALRITVTRGTPEAGPTLVVATRAVVAPPPEGARVAIASHEVVGGDPLGALKSTDRLRFVLAREEAAERGAFEALLPTAEGDLSEGTISNLFVRQGRRVLTPGRERGCLGGITRSHALAVLREERWPEGPLEVFETRVEREDLARADEVFLTNTTARVIPVVGVLDLPEWKGSPGAPCTAWLLDRLLAREDAYRKDTDRADAPWFPGASLS